MQAVGDTRRASAALGEPAVVVRMSIICASAYSPGEYADASQPTDEIAGSRRYGPERVKDIDHQAHEQRQGREIARTRDSASGVSHRISIVDLAPRGRWS